MYFGLALCFPGVYIQDIIHAMGLTLHSRCSDCSDNPIYSVMLQASRHPQSSPKETALE